MHIAYSRWHIWRSCRGRAVRTSDFHTGGPRFEPRPGSSALGQGALSSLPSLSEETLSRRVGPVYRREIPYARKRTHFTSRKE